MSRTIVRAIAVSAMALGVYLGASDAHATSENWYMKMNCQPKYPYNQPNFGLNQYGYYAGTGNAEFYCQQPHLLGNVGFTAAYAYVYDRNTTVDVEVDLCVNNEYGSAENCFNNSSVGAKWDPQTLSWPSTVDSRDYYYFYVNLPPKDPNFDPNYGFSNITSIFFVDN